MNHSQRMLFALVAANLLLVSLFPPFNDLPLGLHGAGTFAGFYPAWGGGRLEINRALLVLVYFFITANALVAWLALARNPRRPQLGSALLTLVNLGIILLFPPFEYLSDLVSLNIPSFESFFFAFGDRASRNIFMPLLMLEILFVLVNGLVAYLLIRPTPASLNPPEAPNHHMIDHVPVHERRGARRHDRPGNHH